MKIIQEFLQSFDPCQDLWDNYLRHYSKWKGSLSEFLNLENITTEDKLWVFVRKIPELEKVQRQFAFICASRTVDNCGIKEIEFFFNATILIYESGELDLLSSDEYSAADRAAYSAADSAAYWVANRTAYSAADRAAYWVAYSAAYSAADRAAYWVVDRAAYSAAGRAADRAAGWAKEREIQLEIAKSLATRL